MATVEGNLEALLEAADQLLPPVRTGQKANKNQDEVGPPFITTTYRNVTDQYATYDVNTGTFKPCDSAAPGWCYGMILEPDPGGNGASSGGPPTQFFASFGAASKANEVLLVPGQTMLFLRGARRIFIRSNQPSVGYSCRITWILDRYASIGAGGNGSPVAVRTWQGDQDTIQVNANDPNGIYLDVPGYTYLSFAVVNYTNQTVTWNLHSLEFDIDTGTIPAGANRLLSYGPGVTNLGGTLTGHGIVVPSGPIIFELNVANPATATGQMLLFWRAY